MKTICTIIMSLALYSTIMAQTPESITARLPKIPTAQQIINSASIEGDTVYNKIIESFYDKLDNIIDEENKKNKHASADIIEAVDADLKKDYGISIDELNNMSDEEKETWGKGQATKKLGSYGINKNVDELENMNDAEKEQMISAMMTQMTGMSMSDVKAMENMSDEEMGSYMMKKSREGNLPSAQSSSLSEANVVQTQNGALEQLNLSKELHAMFEEINIKYQSVREKSKQIWDTKYQTQLIAIRKELTTMGYYDELQSPQVLANLKAKESYIDGLLDKSDKLDDKYYAETIPMWYNTVLEAMNKIKTQGLPIAKKLDTLRKQEAASSKSQSNKAVANSISYANMLAIRYLEEARNLTDYENPNYAAEE